MKIYTRTGDTGMTGLFGGGRVSKAHLRVEAYGSVDELNAVLGQARLHLDREIGDRVRILQADLFVVGAHLATPETDERRPRPSLPPLPGDRIEAMEAWMDAADEELPALEHFVLPGGGAAACALHVARTVCRRAERRVTGLANEEAVDPVLLRYLNRLGDLLFVWARLANRREGIADVEWSG
ncbi:MAG: cob(I)yrinic acid a,c-diamide adenosyltransferase [Gemmatimonadota bacterium]|nr:cob(I)yrinic acid a,c-diamide adenosyltransferase [Gemmatimonadota bacterium]